MEGGNGNHFLKSLFSIISLLTGDCRSHLRTNNNNNVISGSLVETKEREREPDHVQTLLLLLFLCWVGVRSLCSRPPPVRPLTTLGSSRLLTMSRRYEANDKRREEPT